MAKMTKAEYDALVTKDPSTMYLVEDYAEPTFGGISIAPAPLYYGANGFEISENDDWSANSYNDKYGLVEGSYYFAYDELVNYFHVSPPSISTSLAINNKRTISAFNRTGWRVPNKEEMSRVLNYAGTQRPGSTVNDINNVHWSNIRITDISFGTNSYTNGCLFFPDNKVITGVSLTYDSSNYTSVLKSDIDNYLNEGCVFIPCGGEYSNSNNWKNLELIGGYYLVELYSYSSGSSPYNAWIWQVRNDTGIRSSLDHYKATSWYLSRLVNDTPKIYQIYLGSVLIADSNAINDIASILATI